jgi:hypothetical protein
MVPHPPRNPQRVSDGNKRSWNRRSHMMIPTIARLLQHNSTQSLTLMLHLFTMQPQRRHEHDANVVASPSSAFASSSSLSSRPLLPFLYANLFKYCLNLQEYDAYYHLLVHLYESFSSGPCSSSTTATAEAHASENMKLEYLKRFVIELLREHRVRDIVDKYSWSFSWSPTPSTSAGAERRSVREEVEQMLWWHAKSSDMSDELSERSSGGSGSGGHYETLHAFLRAEHLHMRAAQAALHYFYRLESEVHSSGGLSSFIARRVSQAQKGRGRTVQHGANVKPNAEQSVADTAALTLNLLRKLLSRKLWALRSVADALERAARNQSDLFMVEGGASKTSDAPAEDETGSLSHQRSSGADAEMVDAIGRVELLGR